ncbi:MAG: competence/damage-inducible protein A [Deltaproteobacteria bacterium]|nr:competence/damage-inducible protein A [Deltaproteobacteria bacterium]MCF8119993.1 competence/damage-inducible protein A [Deltaproteobacteria bacterium]
MYGEIITIGNELTSGRTVDINSWYAAGRLTASGLGVIRVTSVGDDVQMVTRALKRAHTSSRFVIVTGGLGTTEDDMTCKIAAHALNRPLRLDREMLKKIQHYIDAQGIKMTPPLEKMAYMPEGARMLNPTGGTCGFSIEDKEVRFYFLPGVPEQSRYLMDTVVLPELLGLYEALPVMGQRIIKIYGMNEPHIAEKLDQLRGKIGEVVLGFYPRFPENHLTLSLKGEDNAQVTAVLDRVEQEITAILGTCVFSTDGQDMEEVVGRILVQKEMTLSVAESCTGGLIGHRLTNVPGSSQYYQGGVVSYSNRLKTALLGVNEETLKRHGAVSAKTAKEMAQGVRRQTGSHLGLATTGIAGPEGGTREKPVGTVYIGLCRGEEALSTGYRFSGDRQQIKQQSATMALDWIRRYLSGYSFLPGI